MQFLSPMLDARIRACIHILGGQDRYMPELRQHLDEVWYHLHTTAATSRHCLSAASVA